VAATQIFIGKKGNYLKRSYSTDSDIDFGGPDLTVPMQTGTQQGCKTSSYLF